jgi:hypothetical protein
LTQLLESDPILRDFMMSFARTGDSASFRKVIMTAAQAGDIGAELLLAEQYIPEQCTYERNQDVPHCGKSGNEPPQVVFRRNPLGVDASYEEAARWLGKRASRALAKRAKYLPN